MKKTILIVLPLIAGCASTPTTSYSDLLKDATPSFKSGSCGPELEWTKTLQVTGSVEVEGIVRVKAVCAGHEGND